jgi:ubiquitin-activating enzyme E1
MSNNITNNAGGEIDEDLQSRQLAVYGKQAMGRLRSCNVLLSGLNGLGAEIAKNVILANVKSVTLHDSRNTTMADLGSHFYLQESDVGQNRAVASVKALQELNPSVNVSVLEGELTVERLADFQVVVLIESEQSFAIAADEFCRSQQHAIAFIRTDVNGLFGRVFVDLGPEFVVLDTTGEEPKTAIVTNILPDGHVSCVEEERIDFEEGDWVKFSEVHGMVELNDGEPRKIKNIQSHSFDLVAGVDGCSTYTHGGIVTQVKVPKPLAFQSLAHVLQHGDSEPLVSDFSKFDRPMLLHVLFRALDAFHSANGHLPRPANDDDAAALLEHARALNKDAAVDLDSETSKAIARALAHGAQAVLNPMAAMFGGIVGQEIVKAATGKFHPIFQTFYFESLESLPSSDVPASERQPQNSRYDAQIIVFGREFQRKLGEQHYFLVGAGALGCEFLKNMSMIGLGTKSGGGRISVTDDDTIERSNLSRQFLFRNWHIGKHKAAVAAEAARHMNNDINIVTFQDRVSPLTENVFDDAFWLSLTGVCNALDNLTARRYVDSRCVFFNKNLLESGTLGTKCNTQVVLAHKTENYGASNDPPEKVTPDCTLHNFPHNIQHCLSLARSEFVGNFEAMPAETTAFLESNGQYVEQLQRAGNGQGDIYEKVSKVVDALETRPKSFDDCIAWARLQFQEYFANRINQLTFTFPRDAVTSSGLPFWAPPKRFPVALEFDADDREHMRFIIAAANLRARIFGIAAPNTAGNAAAIAAAAVPSDADAAQYAGNRDVQYFKNVLATIDVPPFTPKSGFKIKVDEKEATAVPGTDELQTLLTRLPSAESLGDLRKLKVEEFEKDHDWNFHMDFIGSAGNLRARNYEIAEVDALQAKLIAGRIIPAIATATALATGLVMLELYKIINDKQVGAWDKVGDFRNAFVNLGLPLLSFSDPTPPARVQARTERRYPDPIKHPEYFEEEEIAVYPEQGFTAWDKLEIRIGDCTIRELQKHFATLGLTLCSLSVGLPDGRALMMYHSAMKGTHARLDSKISLVYEELGKVPLTRPYILPGCYLTNDDMNDVDVPTIVLYLKE